MPNTPGRRPLFTEQQVFDAIRTQGVDNFTFSSLSKQLGVTTSALYRVAPTRHALLGLYLESIPFIAGTEFDAFTSVESSATEVWNILENNPGLSKTLLFSPSFDKYLAPVFTRLGEHLITKRHYNPEAVDFITTHVPPMVILYHYLHSERSQADPEHTTTPRPPGLPHYDLASAIEASRVLVHHAVTTATR